MSEEKTIIRKVIEGDVDAFKLIIEQYNKLIFSIAAKRVPPQECPEVVQDIYLEIFKSLEKYNDSLPFQNWMVRIAVRKCYDFWRKKNREKEKIFVSYDGNREWFNALEHSLSIDDFKKKINSNESLELVSNLMEMLSPEDRLMIDLIYFEQRPLAEVAEILNWKLSKVKVRSMRAKEKLRKQLKIMMDKE